MASFDVDFETRKQAKRPSFHDKVIVPKQKGYQQLTTVLESEPRDRKAAIRAVDKRLSAKRKERTRGWAAKPKHTVDAIKQAASTLVSSVKNFPSVIQAPFNTATHGLFCCIRIETKTDF